MSGILRFVRRVKSVRTSYANFITYNEREPVVSTMKFNFNLNHVSYRCSSAVVEPVENTSTKETNKTEVFDCIRKIDKYMEKFDPMHKKLLDNTLLKDTGKLHSYTMKYLLTCFIRSVHLMDAKEKKEILDTLWSYITTQDFFHFQNCQLYLNIIVSNNLDFSPTDFLLLMSDKNIEPDVTIYEKLVQYYCQKGNITGATKVVKTMTDCEIPISIDIYNSLIIGYANTGDLQSAINIMQTIQDNGLNFTKNTYYSMMYAYAHNNDIDKIKELYATSKSNKMFLTDKEIFSVLYVLVKNNHLQDVHELLQYFDVEITFRNCTTFINNLIDINKTEIAFNCIIKYVEQCGVSPENVQALQMLISKILNHPEVSEMICSKCLDLANMDLLIPSVQSAFLIGNNKLALRLIDVLFIKDFPIESHFFWPILASKGQNSNFSGVLNTLTIMNDKYGVQPCIDTLKDFVLPFSTMEMEKLCSYLLELNVSENAVHNAIVHNLLRGAKINLAYDYIQKHPTTYWYAVLQHELRRAIFFSLDAVNFIKVSCNLRGLISEDEQHSSASGEHSDIKIIPIQNQLRDLVLALPKHKLVLRKIFESVENGDIDIPTETSQEILKFCSTSFIKQDGNKGSDRFSSSIGKLQRLCVNNNLEGARKLMNTISPDFHISAKTHMMYIKLLIENKKLDEVREHLNNRKFVGDFGRLHAQYFWVDVHKILNKAQRLEFLNMIKQSSNEQVYLQFVSGLFDMYCNMNNYTEALDLYLQLPQNMHFRSRFSQKLYKELITQNETTLLQKFVNHVAQLVGQDGALCDLLFNFIELKKTNQAARTFKMIHLHKVNPRMSYHLKRFQNAKDVDSLNMFIDISINDSKRKALHAFSILLTIWDEANDWEAAQERWNSIKHKVGDSYHGILIDEQVAALIKRNNQNESLSKFSSNR